MSRPSTDVRIKWETGDKENDRHIRAYNLCLKLFVRELEGVPEVKPLLDKYCVIVLDDGGVNLDFPEGIDRSSFPEDLR